MCIRDSVFDVSEKIRKIATHLGCALLFTPTTFGKLLTVTIPVDPVFNTKNTICTIPYECCCEYMSKSCQPLQAHANKKRVNDQRCLRKIY